jgi:hypothetical protein
MCHWTFPIDTFKPDSFPPYFWDHDLPDEKRRTVNYLETRTQIKLDSVTGNYGVDEKMANKAAGLQETPDGYVWHHVEDGRTRQLIPKKFTMLPGIREGRR